MKVKSERFGVLSNGKQADIITLDNGRGVVCKFTNFGATLTSWEIPDKNGERINIVLGWDNLKGFEEDTSYHGAVIGRFGNRISNGKFKIDHEEFTLAVNQHPNHLHGGVQGFNKVIWDYTLVDEPGKEGVKFHYLSKHMEEGYPGNLSVYVTYRLTNNNELRIEYEATTDKKTVINLTNHAYFNLNGCKKDILKHRLQIKAGHYTPVNENMIPTGEIKSLTGTDLDFNEFHEIGERIKNLTIGGYDHNFVLDKPEHMLDKIAEVFDPESGLRMEVSTTEPGVQLYTAIHFDGSVEGRNGIKYNKYFGFCLETQHYPDSPNQPGFPSTFLSPGDVYKQTTIYKVSLK
ncbi:MAG: galactose mutarotase [Bacteroidales bacterium]|nr:galactose mutarotase [Bacteroidales bacterium]